MQCDTVCTAPGKDRRDTKVMKQNDINLYVDAHDLMMDR